MRTLDEKHHIENDEIIKTTNGTKIPLDEPVILFRGRDKLAITLLNVYRLLCLLDGCTPYQMESMDRMIAKFEKFKEDNPTVIKQPGITLGK